MADKKDAIQQKQQQNVRVDKMETSICHYG